VKKPISKEIKMAFPDCSMAELQAVLLARDLRDGEKAIVDAGRRRRCGGCRVPAAWSTAMSR
jgi:hypothetical protein